MQRNTTAFAKSRRRGDGAVPLAQCLTGIWTPESLMTATIRSKRLGFFTRLLDRTSAGERYRLATEQIVHAERHGFDTAWVAQHHFHEDKGGLPAPFVFLAQAAAKTSRIRLGTGS